LYLTIDRQIELTDAELQELWTCGLEAIVEVHGSHGATGPVNEDMFPDMRPKKGHHRGIGRAI